MKKIIKNLFFILIFISLIIFIFNIAYQKLGYGYFSKAISNQNNTTFSRDSQVKFNEERSYKIENKDYNNASFYKNVKLKKNTPYKISCMVKTENVDVLDNKYINSGAKITVLDSQEQSNAVIGTSDWQKVTLMFNSKQHENLKIGFMLGGDSENGNVKGTAWFSDLKIEEGKLDSDNNWNFACFIFKNTDVTISNKRYNYKMSNDDISQINKCMERFKNTCAEFSNNNMTVSYKIIEIDKPINELSYDEQEGYYISGENVSKQIDSYLEKEEFDHIIICSRLTDDTSGIPINDWIGLGNMEYKGIGFSNIRMPTSSKSYQFIYSKNLNTFPEEVFVHEFLHTLERNSEEYGYDVPKLHDNKYFGYDEDAISSLHKWYEAYMKKEINNSKGLDPQIYKLKPVKESNFNDSIQLDEFEEPKNIIDKLKAIMNIKKNNV